MLKHGIIGSHIFIFFLSASVNTLKKLLSVTNNNIFKIVRGTHEFAARQVEKHVLCLTILICSLLLRLLLNYNLACFTCYYILLDKLLLVIGWLAINVHDSL